MTYTGTVKWFNEAKGYGFIRRDDGPDLFVHYTNIVGTGFRTLKEDDKVEFEVSEGPKGLQAINVSKISET
jgi:CspA family cold shock protein